jgi:hypothetical protein
MSVKAILEFGFESITDRPQMRLSSCVRSLVHALFPSQAIRNRVKTEVWEAVLNRHGFERICKLRTAVTAHPVGLALQCEHTAEVNVVTPKKEIKDS